MEKKQWTELFSENHSSLGNTFSVWTHGNYMSQVTCEVKVTDV